MKAGTPRGQERRRRRWKGRGQQTSDGRAPHRRCWDAGPHGGELPNKRVMAVHHIAVAGTLDPTVVSCLTNE